MKKNIRTIAKGLFKSSKCVEILKFKKGDSSKGGVVTFDSSDDLEFFLEYAQKDGDSVYCLCVNDGIPSCVHLIGKDTEEMHRIGIEDSQAMFG